MNGPSTINVGGVEAPLVSGSGSLELLANPVGEMADVAALAKHLEAAKSTLKNMNGLSKGLYGFTNEGK